MRLSNLVDTPLHQSRRQGGVGLKHLGEGARWVRGEGGARRLEDLTTHIQLEPLLVVGLVFFLKRFELLPHFNQPQLGCSCLDKRKWQIRRNGDDSMSEVVQYD